jgi:radical SAM protein with 4Fe4S-binding SPASM domain
MHRPETPVPAWGERPFIVIWEVTRACALACRHCRAEAIPRRNPLELEGAEVDAFLDQVVEAAPTLFILTGGDPMARPDLLEIVGKAAERGLSVSMSPSATPRFLRADLPAYRRAGLKRVSLSIDGATRETHDAFRGVPGTWDRTMEAYRLAREAGLEVQVNTTFTRQNLAEFDAFAELLLELEPALWSAFMLVPTGRGRNQELPSAPEMEGLFGKLFDFAQRAPFPVKTTEGPHFRRVSLQRWWKDRRTKRPEAIGVNDGKGFVFVSHIGEIQPSGFLPVTAGNVREGRLADVYRRSPIFRALRDPEKLKGKCHRCEFHNLCGGSRARAYALTGDYLAQEPLCCYEPRGPYRTDDVWRGFHSATQ